MQIVLIPFISPNDQGCDCDCVHLAFFGSGLFYRYCRDHLAPSSRHGEVLWEREAAGLGWLGAASSESTAGSGRLRACGRSLAAVDSAAVSAVAWSCGCVVGFGWL